MTWEATVQMFPQIVDFKNPDFTSCTTRIISTKFDTFHSHMAGTALIDVSPSGPSALLEVTGFSDVTNKQFRQEQYGCGFPPVAVAGAYISYLSTISSSFDITGTRTDLFIGESHGPGGDFIVDPFFSGFQPLGFLRDVTPPWGAQDVSRVQVANLCDQTLKDTADGGKSTNFIFNSLALLRVLIR